MAIQASASLYELNHAREKEAESLTPPEGLPSNTSQRDIELSSLRVDITAAKKTATTFQRWRYKTFTEKQLQQQDSRKGEAPPTHKRKNMKDFRPFILGTMPGWAKEVKKYPILDFVDYNLRGSGQVIFCNNSLTGLSILVAIYIGSVWIGVCSTIGLVTATVTALLLNFNMGAIRAGLFGYNGVLVGAALGTFLANGTWSGSTVAAICIMSMFSTLVASAIGTINSTWKLPTFTLPFNFSAIIFMLGVYHFLHFAMLPDMEGSLATQHGVIVEEGYWKAKLPLAVLRGVSQVWLINNEYSGAVILVGMSFCSPISAFFALFGSALGSACAMALGASAQEIFAGLWGYNAVLGCVAIGGVFYVLCWKVFTLAFLCGIFCTILLGTFKGLFSTLGMPAFTFPFCMGTIVFILIQPALPDVISMPLPSITTPEQHIRLRKIAKRAIIRMRQNVTLAQKKKLREGPKIEILTPIE